MDSLSSQEVFFLMVVGSLNSCEDRKSIREPGTAIVWAERSSERVPRRFAHATALILA